MAGSSLHDRKGPLWTTGKHVGGVPDPTGGMIARRDPPHHRIRPGSVSFRRKEAWAAGSPNFAASRSAVLMETVAGASSSTTLTASPNPALTGRPVVLEVSEAEARCRLAKDAADEAGQRQPGQEVCLNARHSAGGFRLFFVDDVSPRVRRRAAQAVRR